MKQFFIRIVHSFCIFILIPVGIIAQVNLSGKKMYHLRNGNRAEWTGFGNSPQKDLIISFKSEGNAKQYTLDLLQEDVRQSWEIFLNGKSLGHLNRDEQLMRTYFTVPPQFIIPGKNSLHIRQTDTTNDDIRVGNISLHPIKKDELLQQSTVEISITDTKTKILTPARLTITHSRGVLQPVGAVSGEMLAVRTGSVYTGNGKAVFGLPAGKYTIYANRGAAFSVDSFSFEIKAGERFKRNFSIKKEIPLDRWISCDPHLHTFTYSRHGDASLEERVITIAGEEIDLPVFTDHNLHVRPDSVVKQMNLGTYFTPVTGNEFTTTVGHFNVFPAINGEIIPDAGVKNWKEAAEKLEAYHPDKIIILNHARDHHYGFQPFGPRRHIAVAGLALDGWKLPANAMEVMNSGSQQHNRMELFMDWFGMMNSGQYLTPVGSSDSHDVFRYIAGQSRTYIYYGKTEPGKMDIGKAVQNFIAGKVMVSFGLVTMIKVNNSYGPGDLAEAGKQVDVNVSVYGPSWLDAEKIILYVNGIKFREEKILQHPNQPLKWQGNISVPVHNMDFFLVAIAEGPGKSLPFWPIPNPYQQTSPDWHPGVIGSSGAVWVDADGDGKRTSARGYAEKLYTIAGSDLSELNKSLSVYDEAVSVQYAALLYENGLWPEVENLLVTKNIEPVIKRGFLSFKNSLDESKKVNSK